MQNVNYVLDEIERRVLGVLMEKSMSQPEYYPMTLNSIVTGCNQKNNRDPVMELDEGVVWSALERLRGRGLVQRILPSPGSRADKFKHDVEQQFNWQSPQRAIMTELMLRGPQTAGELRTRCARMHEFESPQAVSQALESLMNWTPPLVAPLARGPRESAPRYAHLLAPASEAAAGAVAIAAPPPPTRRERAEDIPPPAAADARLATELESMQAEIADLHELVSELRRRIEALESRVDGK